MKIPKRTGRTGELVITPDVFEDRRQEAYWAKPARERALDALVVANRVIKQQIARQADAKKSETVKTRR
jgi:hypothetical protein